MFIKSKLLSMLNQLRKVFFPSNNEMLAQVEQLKEPGFCGKLFISMYFPTLNKNMSKQKCQKLLLNRAILIASFMGTLCLWSKYFELSFIEGVFLLLALTSWFPYMTYLIVKKH